MKCYVPSLYHICVVYAQRCDAVVFIHNTPPQTGEWSIVMTVSVCPFVCPRADFWNYTSDVHQFFVHVTYGRGSVLLWWRSDTLRIYGFTDDVIFARKPRLLDVAPN